MPPHSRHGFTLIELSIVLVIIGLVVGGILMGKTLIRSAQLQRLISDKVVYETAFYAFQNKYNCLAGDCPNATDFFGASSDCADAHCKDLTASGGTCNYGNGNGMIDGYFGGITTPYLTEDLLLWNQLGLAGMVSGKYWGGYCGYTSVTVPVSALKNNSIWWANTGIVVAGKTAFTIGKPTGQAWGASLNAADAFSLDNKIDDGNPNSGRVRSREGFKPDQSGFYANGCRVGNTYDTAQDEERCLISFVIR